MYHNGGMEGVVHTRPIPTHVSKQILNDKSVIEYMMLFILNETSRLIIYETFQTTQ